MAEPSNDLCGTAKRAEAHLSQGERAQALECARGVAHCASYSACRKAAACLTSALSILNGTKD